MTHSSQEHQHRHADEEIGELTEQLRRAEVNQQPQDSSFEDLLDQIDAVIQENPQGYVRSFVQRGGE